MMAKLKAEGNENTDYKLTVLRIWAHQQRRLDSDWTSRYQQRWGRPVSNQLALPGTLPGASRKAETRTFGV
jgi:hypothetical protein